MNTDGKSAITLIFQLKRNRQMQAVAMFKQDALDSSFSLTSNYQFLWLSCNTSMNLVFTPYSVKQNQFTKTYANQLYNKRFQSSDHFQVILKIYKGIKDKAHFQMNSKNKYHNRNNNRNSYANTLYLFMPTMSASDLVT